MKKFKIFLVIVIILQTGYAQRQIVASGLGTFSGNPNSQGPASIQPSVNASPIGNLGAMYGESKKFSYEDLYVEGSQYLFNSWENNAIIFADDKKYIISNMNFNMDRQQFVSKFSDSVYVYNLETLNKIAINGRTFKNIYNASEGKDNIYEVLYTNSDFSIIKENYISIKEASPNPQLNRPNRKIIKKTNYFVYDDETLTKFKLKKSDLLDLFDDEEKLKLENYASLKRLSYKNPDDVDKMLRLLN